MWQCKTEEKEGGGEGTKAVADEGTERAIEASRRTIEAKRAKEGKGDP